MGRQAALREALDAESEPVRRQHAELRHAARVQLAQLRQLLRPRAIAENL